MTVSKQIKDRLLDAVITAFVFAAALAWKDTLTAVLNKVLPFETTIWSNIIVTLLITVIVIGLVYSIIKADDMAEANILSFSDRDQYDEKPKPKSKIK